MRNDDFSGQSEDSSTEGGSGEGDSWKVRVAREKQEAKKVNAMVSAELRREKELARKNRSGVGKCEKLLDAVCAAHRNNPKRQAAEFLKEAVMPAMTGRNREVSYKTRSDFGDNLLRAIDQLREIGMPVRNLDELGRAQVIALLGLWKSQGLVAATIQTKLSAMRKFFALVGKEYMVPKGKDLYQLLAKKGIDHGGLRRTQVVTLSKSWTQRGVELEKVLRDVYAMDPLVGIQLKLQGMFGLRLNEVLHMQPLVSDNGRQLLVLDGTKGGRVRFFDFSADPVRATQQREALEEAKNAAEAHPRGVLLRKRQSVHAARKRYEYVLRKCGVTKSQKGVTGHGLRHEFAANLYEEVSGLRPPVEDVHTPQEYEDKLGAVEQAELAVSAALGHARPSISGAYNGSRFQLAGSKMTREGRMLLNNLVDVLEDVRVANVFREHGTDTAWLTGAAARGVLQSTDQPIEITVRMNIQPGGLAGAFQRFEELDAKLGKVVQRKVVLVMWAKLADPDPAEDGYVRVFGW